MFIQGKGSSSLPAINPNQDKMRLFNRKHYVPADLALELEQKKQYQNQLLEESIQEKEFLKSEIAQRNAIIDTYIENHAIRQQEMQKDIQNDLMRRKIMMMNDTVEYNKKLAQVCIIS